MLKSRALSLLKELDQTEEDCPIPPSISLLEDLIGKLQRAVERQRREEEEEKEREKNKNRYFF